MMHDDLEAVRETVTVLRGAVNYAVYHTKYLMELGYWKQLPIEVRQYIIHTYNYCQFALKAASQSEQEDEGK